MASDSILFIPFILFILSNSFRRSNEKDCFNRMSTLFFGCCLIKDEFSVVLPRQTGNPPIH